MEELQVIRVDSKSELEESQKLVVSEILDEYLSELDNVDDSILLDE